MSSEPRQLPWNYEVVETWTCPCGVEFRSLVMSSIWGHVAAAQVKEQDGRWTWTHQRLYQDGCLFRRSALRRARRLMRRIRLSALLSHQGVKR